MGGSIRVVIRFSDGTVYSATRHTNPFPHRIRRTEFIDGDETLLRAYAEQKSDYETDDRIAPADYGIFVVDFVSKTVLSYNSYSDCQGAPIMDRVRLGEYFSLEDENDGGFQRLIEQGRLIIRYATPLDPLATLDVPIPRDAYATWDETIYEAAERMNAHVQAVGSRLAINYAPWTLTSYWPRNRANKRLLIQQIKDLGFTIGDDRETRMRWGRLAISGR